MTLDKDLLSIYEARTIARDSEKAQKLLASFDEAEIDIIIKAMVNAAVQNAEKLAEMAVEDTGFGRVEDKILKNLVASKDLYDFIGDMKTVGIINRDEENGIIEIAEPMGVILGIIPSTNPTSTAIFKSIISLKSRNGIVMTPHPAATRCTYEAAMIMAEAAESAGAPKGIIGCMRNVSMQATNELMKCPQVSMILATGGPGMVKAAYSAGKPALGVGPGNSPVFIERSADVKKAVNDIIIGKTFDNSTICASEQSLVVENCIKAEVVAELKKAGAYFMTTEETEIVGNCVVKPNGDMNAAYVGKSAEDIAKKAGINIPAGTKVLIGEQLGVGKGFPLSYEKLTCVLGFYTVDDWKEACNLCIELLNNGGVGHTMCIHSQNEDIIMRFAEKPVFRILVNVPSSLGGVGVLTGLSPSFTLGCGTWGGSATSDNVTPLHLINIKRIAYGIKDFKREEPACTTTQESISNKIGSVSSTDIANIVEDVLRSLKDISK